MTGSLQTAEASMRLPLFVLDAPIPPFEWTAPDGRVMQLELRKNGAHWSLAGSFEWYDPPEDALGPFIQVAQDFAAVLTLKLGVIVEQQGAVNIHLPDDVILCPPSAFDVLGPVRGPSADEWVRLTQSDANRPLSSLARDLLARYRQSLDHGQYVLSDANYCLTRLEKSAPGGRGSARRRASDWFRIDYSILDRIGHLAATRGDNLSARKAPEQPLSDSELNWIRGALHGIVLHVAFADSDTWLREDDLIR